MIGKGQAIAHTGNCMAYGWDESKGAEVVHSQHLAGENARQVTEEFRLVQEQNTRCEKNTLSFVLSPTPEEGKELSKRQLQEMVERFLKEMQLKERQAIAFVHRNKAHTHVHVYVNRIGLDGSAYKDSFIGKQSQLAAERVAKQMGLTTVREVQLEKELDSIRTRIKIRDIHLKVMHRERPRTLEGYMKKMKAERVKVVPTINKSGKLQGFRLEYKGQNFKASEVHRSMSGGKVMAQLSRNNGIGRQMEAAKAVKLMGKTVELSGNLATSIAKNLIKKTIKKAIDTGIGI